MDTAQVPLHTVTAHRWGKARWALAIFLLLAWALRFPPLLDNRFHPDEALYGYWGLLIGTGRDPWLAAAPVYKPPLLPYLIAGAQALFGNSEFSVRLPGLAAGLLTMPLTAALAHSLYRDRWVTMMAAAAVALSPFAILFSATAFTDPLMVTLGLAACVAAARDRPVEAGLLAGLSAATKQTGLVWLPLAAMLQISNHKSHCSLYIGHCSLDIGHCSLLIGHWSLIILLVWGWDAVRVAHGAESFWRTGVSGYGGLRLIWPQELWPRLRGWVGLLRYFFASSVVNGALLLGLPVLVWSSIVRQTYARRSLMDLLLVSFALVYLLLHWLLAFPVWDRYLLPLTPVLAVLLARALALLTFHIRSALSQLTLPHWSLLIVNCSLVTLLLFPAWDAVHSRYPVGGDHGAYDGIDQVAAFLRRLPEGAVVYQHWLGWQYEYYLFGGPVYLAYWPNPAWLARDVQAFGARDPRYITFPSWESPARVEQALSGIGYGLQPELTTVRRDGTRSFTVYHIARADDG